MVKLRWYQEEAVTATYKYFANNSIGNPIIALPTGTGKSHVLGEIQRRALEMWPDQRFLNLTHVKELIKQNAEKLIQSWPQAPVGIYSAGLNKKQYLDQIVFAGIASLAKSPELVGHRDLVIVDECHLIGNNSQSMYLKLIGSLTEINPHLRVAGLTATPYRQGQGLLVDGPIFDDVCYDLTGVKGFNRLIRDGYLAPLYPVKTAIELDTSGVKITSGDYNKKALQEAVNITSNNIAAIKEMCDYGYDRKSWLIFASGIEHSEAISSVLNEMGIIASFVHSKMKARERDNRIDQFKKGNIRCLVNNNILTTGFDHPPIDLIGMLRPTTSTSLWVQMLGRGTRPCPGKDNCLVLDFAGNTRRLGPINDPQIPTGRKGAAGDAPVRICDNCGTYNHLSAPECISCGEEFPRTEKLSKKSSDDQLIRYDEPIIKTLELTSVVYRKHVKRSNGNTSLEVTYYCGLSRYREWKVFGGKGFAKKKSDEWWAARSETDPPETVDDAEQRSAELKVPTYIKVSINQKYPEIVGVIF